MATLHSCSLHFECNRMIPYFPSARIPSPLPLAQAKKKPLRFHCRSSSDNSEEYLLDAPVSIGDGFSFCGGKYSDKPSPADEWFKIGKFVKAHPVSGSGEKVKDPIFGLTMGGSSQTSSDLFRITH